MSYLIIVDDQQEGPFTADQIRTKLAADEISPDTLIWADGWDTWYPVEQVQEFATQTTVLAEVAEVVSEKPGSAPPPSQSNETKPNSGFVANLKKGAEIAKKQAAIKKLELGDLKAAHTKMGQVIFDNNPPMDAFASEVGKIATIDQEIETLGQAPPINPEAKIAEKAKAAAAATKAKVMIEAARMKRKHAIESMGARAVAEAISVPGAESHIAGSEKISKDIADIQVEIDALGAGAHPLAKHPFLVVAVLAVVIAIGFVMTRDSKPEKPDYAAMREQEFAREAQKNEERRLKDYEKMKESQANQSASIQARKDEDAIRKQEASERNAKRKIEREFEAKEKEKKEAEQIVLQKEAAKKRSQGRNIQVNPTFLPTDFEYGKLLRAFYSRTKPTEPKNLVEYLLSKFSDPGYQRIQSAHKADLAKLGSGRTMISKVFVAEFNEVIGGPLIYDARWFPVRQQVGIATSEIEFSLETKELLEEVQFGYSRQYIPHLNRLLIENVFENLVQPTVRQALFRSAGSRVDLTEETKRLKDTEINFRIARRKKVELTHRDLVIIGKHIKDLCESGIVPNYVRYDADWKRKKLINEALKKNPALRPGWEKVLLTKTAVGPTRSRYLIVARAAAEERLKFEGWDRDGKSGLSLAEFKIALGSKVIARQKTVGNMQAWEASLSSSGRVYPLSWHEVWLTKLDLDDNGGIDIEEWLAHKGIGTDDVLFHEHELLRALAFAEGAPSTWMPNSQERVVKCTLDYALLNGLVTAQVGGGGYDSRLRIERTALVKGMDLYLSLVEGAVITPSDLNQSRMVIARLGDSQNHFLGLYSNKPRRDPYPKGNRLVMLPAHMDAGDERLKVFQWSINILQLDLGKPLPSEYLGFTIQSKYPSEFGTLLMGLRDYRSQMTTRALWKTA
ncbi:DUF4339 domain-containing protein, partial [Verrucomicrobia bacterium]|nr:DUF4339 domain-containing protein [Verrucomicrobiota bacterium]